ncbi:hypothetical protein evm_012339 [Chilo suppressalis]|nr:hypothetical protein evm_012339 [Chilo suppressalis]
MGDLLSRVPPCFGRHVKPLVPAASTVVSTHQYALGPRECQVFSDRFYSFSHSVYVPQAAMADYGQTGTLTLKWDPKNLEIRTTSVERTLEPLVLQVTTLVNSKDKAAKKKRPGKSKRASALVATVERATEIFIERGQTIAYENPDITQEMLAAVEEVRKAGAAMSVSAREFSEQPCASMARSSMVRAARALLSAVTRLLILADLADVRLLLASTRTVESDLDKLKCASSQSELVESARQFGRSAAQLAAQAARRQKELREPATRDNLAAARAVLKKHSTMLLTASKVYVRHPELAAAKANRDYVLRAVCSAVGAISAAAHGRPHHHGTNRPAVEGPGELAQALDDFDERMVMEPLAYSELRTRPSLEERLESIISGAALMADSSCTRDERRERIVAECNAVRQALQDLLHEYMTNPALRPGEMGRVLPNALNRATKNQTILLRSPGVRSEDRSRKVIVGPTPMKVPRSIRGTSIKRACAMQAGPPPGQTRGSHRSGRESVVLSVPPPPPPPPSMALRRAF